MCGSNKYNSSATAVAVAAATTKQCEENELYRAILLLFQYITNDDSLSMNGWEIVVYVCVSVCALCMCRMI